MDNHLTDRQVEILTLARDGLINQAIANSIGVSENTVKRQFQIIFDKLGAVDRTTAVVIAIRRGIITLE